VEISRGSPNSLKVYDALKVLSSDEKMYADVCKTLRTEGFVTEITDDAVDLVFTDIYNKAFPLHGKVSVWDTLKAAGSSDESILALYETLLPNNNATEVFKRSCKDSEEGGYLLGKFSRAYRSYSEVKTYMRWIDMWFSELQELSFLDDMAGPLVALDSLSLNEMTLLCDMGKRRYGITETDLNSEWWTEISQYITPETKGTVYWAALIAENQQLKKVEVQALVEADQSLWVALSMNITDTKSQCKQAMNRLDMPTDVIFDNTAMKSWINMQAVFEGEIKECFAALTTPEPTQNERETLRDLETFVEVISVVDLNQNIVSACDTVINAMSDKSNEVEVSQLELALLRCRDEIYSEMELVCADGCLLNGTDQSCESKINSETSITVEELSVFKDGSYPCIDAAKISGMMEHLQPQLEFCVAVDGVSSISIFKGIEESFIGTPANMTELAERLILNYAPAIPKSVMDQHPITNIHDLQSTVSPMENLQIYLSGSGSLTLSKEENIKKKLYEEVGFNVKEIISFPASSNTTWFSMFQISVSTTLISSNAQKIKDFMEGTHSFTIRDVQISESNDIMNRRFETVNIAVLTADLCAINTNQKKLTPTYRLSVVKNPCICETEWRDSGFCGDSTQNGCTNCNNEPNGPWCYVSNFDCDTDEGGGWSYCDLPSVNVDSQSVDGSSVVTTTTGQPSSADHYKSAAMLLVLAFITIYQ